MIVVNHINISNDYLPFKARKASDLLKVSK